MPTNGQKDPSGQAVWNQGANNGQGAWQVTSQQGNYFLADNGKGAPDWYGSNPGAGGSTGVKMDANGNPIDVGHVEGAGGLPSPVTPVWDKTANLIQHGQLSTPGNPAGAAVNVQAGTPNGLRQDTTTGYYLDPDSHDVYELGADGKYYPVQDLGVRAQVAKNIATADYYSGLAKDYNGAITSNMAAQRSLADAYRTTISDPNAPSVAREQLNQALHAADATQLSQAAGASGANAYIARRNAAQNIASLNAKAGGAAAELRAGEVANAQKGLGATLGQIGTEATDIYKANTGLGYNYSNLGSDEELGAVSSDTTRRAQNDKRLKDIAAGASGVTAPTPPTTP